LHTVPDSRRETADILGEIQALEQRYEALFGMQPDPIFAVDPEGRIMGGNAALQMLTGQDMRDLLGRSFISLIAAEDADRGWRHFQRVLHGEAQSFEITAVTGDGRDVTLAVTLAPTWIDDAVQGAHGVARDVTRAREAEYALRDVQERYSVLSENVQDMISLHDPAGAFIYASPSAWKLLGYHPVELVGRSVYDLVEAEDVATLQAAHAAIMRRDGRGPVSFRARRRDDTIGWFESTARMVLHEETGQPWQIIAVTRDITARRAMERQFLQSQKMEALGRMASAVAHDFNNALTVIAGRAELLTQEDAADVIGGAEHIRESARRASALARQLLEFGRGADAESVPLDVNAMLLDLQPLMARLLGETVRLTLELETALLRVEAPPSALEHIAVQLAVHAREAMPRGGELLIRTENLTLQAGENAGLQAGEHVRLTIADSGDGMAPDVLAHIFEPFFSTRMEQGGSGLGLSTVYAAVRQAGGDIEVLSEPGVGTDFRITLPASRSAALPAERAPGTVDPLQGTETILVAEDDVGVRSLITAVLQRHGYSVMTAANGREALELYQTYGHLVDAIITDVNMPMLTGPEFVRSVHEAGARLPVIYISGFTADLLPAADGGRREFLSKPFTPLQLARTVRQLLGPAGD
jgi:two-component system, cell cycle sensor histidine kinase and response regulator CckA